MANGEGTAHWCPAIGGCVTVAGAGKSIDWNCDGNTVDQRLTFDVNNGTATKSTGLNDWEKVQVKVGSARANPSSSINTCGFHYSSHSPEHVASRYYASCYN